MINNPNMRKYLLAILLFTLSLPAVAQKRWSVIPQAGIQLSRVKCSEDLGQKPTYSYRAGALVEYQFSQGVLGNIGLQSGVMATLKGMGNNNGSREIEAHYLEIPLLLNWGIHLTSETDLLLKAGPFFAYRFADKSVVYDPLGPVGNTPNPFYCPYDYGIECGLGLEYRSLMLNFGANLGLYDFYIDRSADPNFQMKNQTLHMSIGCRF